MKIALATLEGISPYSQSKYHTTEKLPKELPKDYESRTWRERMHTNSDGQVFIPPMVFKNCLSNVAKYLSVSIPGKGKSTYTKHFTAGVLVMEPLLLPIKKEEVLGEWLLVPSDGKAGGGSRVEKCFPIIHKWSGEVRYHILDETITHDVFTHHLIQAGSFIGIGRFRPINNGYYGRFAVKQVQWDNKTVFKGDTAA